MPTHCVQEGQVAQQAEERVAADIALAGEEGLDVVKGEQSEEEGNFGGSKDAVGQEDQDSDAGWETDLEIEGSFLIDIMCS